MSKVSVIIPAYNAEKTITEALDSVLAQTHPVDEIIVVDDGSTDDTSKIIKNYPPSSIGHQPIIKYIPQPNSGPAVARNTGIKAAEGEYIAFLDADDVWLPEKIAKQMSVFEQNPDVGLVCTGRIRHETATGKKVVNCVGNRLSGDGYMDFWTYGNYVVTSSVLIKKICFNSTGTFDENPNILGSEDADMWIRISEQYKIFYFNEPLVIYRVSKTGFCRLNIDKNYASSHCFFEKHLPAIKRRSPNYKKIIRKRQFRYYFAYGKTLLDEKRFTESRSRFKHALQYNPVNLKCWGYLIKATLLCFFPKNNNQPAGRLETE